MMNSLRDIFAIARDRAADFVGGRTSTEYRIYKALKKLMPSPPDTAVFESRTAAFLANLAGKNWPVYKPHLRVISIAQRLDVATSLLALVNAAALGEADLRKTYKQLAADDVSASSFRFIEDRVADIEAAAAMLYKADPDLANMFRL
jgi:hypothetical protein